MNICTRSQRLGTSPLVTLDTPSALSTRVINALKADPRTVDLRALAPHFYRFAIRLFDLFEEEEMVDVLSEVGCHVPHRFLAYRSRCAVRPSNRGLVR